MYVSELSEVTRSDTVSDKIYDFLPSLIFLIFRNGNS